MCWKVCLDYDQVRNRNNELVLTTTIDHSTDRDGSGHMVLSVTVSGKLLLTCGWLAFRAEEDVKRFLDARDELRSVVHTVYHGPLAYESSISSFEHAQMIPCHRIWDWSAIPVALVAVYRLEHVHEQI